MSWLQVPACLPSSSLQARATWETQHTNFTGQSHLRIPCYCKNHIWSILEVFFLTFCHVNIYFMQLFFKTQLGLVLFMTRVLRCRCLHSAAWAGVWLGRVHLHLIPARQAEPRWGRSSGSTGSPNHWAHPWWWELSEVQLRALVRVSTTSSDPGQVHSGEWSSSEVNLGR